MKKLLVIIAIALLTLHSCKKDTALSEGMQNSVQLNTMAANSQVRAVVTDKHLDFPGPYTLENHCNGETVVVNGNVGIDMHTVINGSLLNYSEQQQGLLTGTGNFGNTYITTINENIILNGIESTSGVFIINDVTVFRMISKDGTADFMLRRIAHLTVTPNGDVTVDRIDFETTCPI